MNTQRLNANHQRISASLATMLFVILTTASPTSLFAQSITCYSYFSHSETNVLGELLPFDWAADDSINGTVRSNDSLSFAGKNYRVSRVFSAKGVNRGNCEFAHEPVEYYDELALPRYYSHLHEMAVRSYWQGYGSEYKYIVRGRGYNGFSSRVDVYRFSQGQEFLVDTWSIADPQGKVLEFFSDVDVEGVFNGHLTIYSYYNIGLIGDVRYPMASERNGNFSSMERSYLGLVAGANIIIRNTVANGRDNGFGEFPDSLNRHSIVINGSLIALDGSLTFEDQNDEDDDYSGPSPDERGTIYFKGSLAQRQRGLLHRDNHDGTGYRIEARADQRLESWGPPGFNQMHDNGLSGDYDRLTLTGREYTVNGLSVGTLIVEAGASLVFERENYTLGVYDSLIIKGTTRNPVTIRNRSGNNRAVVYGYIHIDHVNFESGIKVEMTGEDATIRYCSFVEAPVFTSSVFIDSCSFDFEEDVSFTGNVSINRSSFSDCGISVSGGDSRLLLNQCSLAGGNGVGVEVKDRASALLVNSTIAFYRYGVKVDNRSEVEIRYCDVAENSMVNYYNCQPGVGCFSADPLFVDLRSSDFRLTENSPCIDAGDPASPRDPDGTVADLGAFWLDRGLDMEEDNPPFNSPPASRGGKGLTASPNPFNATTVIRFEGSLTNREATVRIFDLAGREVYRQAVNPPLASGVNPPRLTPLNLAADRGGSAAGIFGGGSAAESFVWDAFAYPAGIYVVRIDNGSEIHSLKLIKVN